MKRFRSDDPPFPFCTRTRRLASRPGARHGAGRRALACLLSASMAAAGCVGGGGPLRPRPGATEREAVLRIGFGAFEVNAAGGNLLLRRDDFSIDTGIGTIELGSAYNSSTGAWRWSHELFFDGSHFVDSAGTVRDATGLGSGQRMAGSPWIVEDQTTLRTRGGLVHHFGADGLLEVVHWRHSAHPRLVFSEEGIDQCSAAGACESVFEFERDAAGRIVQIDDRAGRRATYTWAGNGALVHVQDPFSRDAGLPGTRYEYGGLFTRRLMAIDSPDGERFGLSYDLVGRVVEVREPGATNPVVGFRYERDRDTDRNVSTVINALGAPCVFEFDDEGRPLAMTNAVGELRHWSWEGFEPASEADAAGALTTHVRGPGSQTTTTPAGNVIVTEWALDALNRADPFAPAIARRSDSVGLVEEREYDLLGRLTALRNGAGTQTRWTYHPDGTLATREGPGEGRLRFAEYGEHGHALLVEHDDEPSDPMWDVPLAYDAVGNLTRGPQLSQAYSPGRPGIVARSFDARRRVAALDLAAQRASVDDQGALFVTYEAGRIEVDRRFDGQPIAVQRPYGADTEFDYDEAGRLVQRRDRVDGAWVVSVAIDYDPVGNVVRIERANGTAEEADFDAQNRPVERRFLRGAYVEQSVSGMTWQADRLLSWTDSAFSAPETQSFDAAGNVVRVDYPGGEALERSFDVRGREVVRRYWWPDAQSSSGFRALREIERSYDDADRPHQLWESGVLVRERQHAGGQIAEVRAGNGLVRSFEWDEQGRLASAQTVDAGGALVVDTHVTRAPCSWTTITCVDAIAESFGPAGAVSRETFWLDSHQFSSLVPESEAGARVLSWSDDFTGGFGRRWYEYDLLGNLSAIGGHDLQTGQPGNAPFQWDDEHGRLLAIPDTEYVFDPQTGQVVLSGARSYAYDDAGFVVQRDQSAVAWTAEGRIASIGADEFRWAIGGRPIERMQSGVTTRFAFDGSVRLDGTGAPASLRIDRDIEVDLVSGGRLYRHLDLRENVRFVSNDAGDVVAHYQYRPMGRSLELTAAAGAVQDPIRFAHGEELGDGLVLIGERVLDTASGRFLSPDPVWNLLGQHAYTHGNPLWFADFDGRLASVLPSDAVGDAGRAMIAAGEALGSSSPIGRSMVALGSSLVVIAMVLSIAGLEVHSSGPARMRERFALAAGCRADRPAALMSAGGPGC